MSLKKIPLIVWLFLGGLILIAVTVFCFQWYYSYEQRHDSVRFYADGLNLAVSDQAETIAIADLKAQQHMAQAAMVMTVASIFSAFVGGAGALLLYITLREQRNLASAQSRAYLEVLVGYVGEEFDFGVTYQLSFVNNGLTPACNIQFIGKMTLNPDHSPDEDVEYLKSELNSAVIPELPPKSETDFLLMVSDPIKNLDWFSADGLGSFQKKFGHNVFERDMVESCLRVDGKLFYEDVFGEHYSIEVRQYMHINFSGRLRGTGRNADKFPVDRFNNKHPKS